MMTDIRVGRRSFLAGGEQRVDGYGSRKLIMKISSLGGEK